MMAGCDGDAVMRQKFLAELTMKPPINGFGNLVEMESVNKEDPLFKKLAQVNGTINRMDHVKIKDQLKLIGLMQTGSEESCRRRLKSFCQLSSIAKLVSKPPDLGYNYDVVCVIDFEATCEKREDIDAAGGFTIQEIIEFPAFLVNLSQRKIVADFHEYVKPKAALSEYCTELTGITEETLKDAEPFIEVFNRFESWLYQYLKSNNVASFAILTDGPWDISHFLARQCQLSSLQIPEYAMRWINLKKLFSFHYKKGPSTLVEIMEYLGLSFEGRRHSGRDDAFNIARTFIHMLCDGTKPVFNEALSWDAEDRVRWPGMECGFIRTEYSPSDSKSTTSDES